ncbi:MAG TPA: radical SAM protein [Symbiobacteriaceae bacterium]|nr:radical SAM protein [Symbiobacteriaceae bacterium]
MPSFDDPIPALPELFVDRRGEQFLLLNPRGPRWCMGSRLAAVFAELCDGRRTLRDIHALMAPHFRGLTPEHLAEVSDGLTGLHFFEEGWRVPRTALWNVIFNLTRTCNLQCPFCYYDSGPAAGKPAGGELTAAEWIRVAGEVAAVNSEAKIYVMGGEPLIRKDAPAIIEGIARHGLNIRLVTNGMLITQELARRLAVVPKLTVQVSIDSILPDENALTRGPDHLPKALNAVRWLKAAGAEVLVSATVTQTNRWNLWRLQAHLARMGVRFRSSFFFVGGERSQSAEGRLALSPDDLWMTALHTARHGSANLTSLAAARLEPGVVRSSCGVGFGTLSIAPDGQIFPCNHLTAPDQLLGSVRNLPIATIAAAGGETYRAVDVDQTPGCAECPVRYICTGACKASASHAYGTMQTPPPDCAFRRRACLETLWTDVLGDAYELPAESPVVQ